MTDSTLVQAVRLYRRTAASRSALLLLAANVIPLVGVAFFGWSLLTILVLYWLENGIVGFWNVPRIAMAQGSIVPTLPDMPDSAARAATSSPEAAAALQESWRRAQAAQTARAAQSTPAAQAAQAVPAAQAEPAAPQPAAAPLPPGAPQPAAAPLPPGTAGMAAMGDAMNRLAGVGRIGLAIFFVFHYGVFWVVHGTFVFALPAFGDGFGMGDGPSAFGDLEWSYVALAAVALFISHGASFVLNYIGRGEFRTASPSRQMGSAYGRVIVLHLTILIGSIVVAFLGAPIAALVVLVALKTAFDLALHLRQHRAADPRLPIGAGSASA